MRELAREPSLADETRRRLLEAAGDIFARYGFARATVRDICQAADANIAAVNYHFRNKEGLYTAVLRDGLARALVQHPPDQGVTHGAGASRLGAFIHSFLQRLLVSDANGTCARLMAREMSEPTAALNLVVQEHIRPLADRLMGIVRELLGADASAEAVMQHTMSIVGQCVFYRHAEQVIAQLWPQQKHTPAQIARLAEHITQFSLAGLAAGREKLPAKRKAAQ